MYNVNRAFDLLKQISFNRIAGSDDELKAANILASEIKKIGLTPIIEEFPVDYSEVVEAKLEILTPFKEEIPCEGIRMTGNAPDGGLEGELLYVEDGDAESLTNAEGKIILLNKRAFHAIYERLIKAKVKGFISMVGSLYDKEDESDLLINQIREKDYELGTIPGLTIRMSDGQKLINKNAQRVRITLKQNQTKRMSRNVMCEIKGNTYPDQIIAFTAHYDSVVFSSGAYDNASGSVGIMELLHHFIENKPARTCRFIWCGAEEMGLLGSKFFTNKYEEEVKNKYVMCINIDMIGVTIGKEFAVSTAENSLVNYIDYLGKEIGIYCKSSQGVYSSDSTPFADKGVPSVSFARLAPSGGAVIHNRNDVIDNLNQQAFDSSLKLIFEFSNRMVNASIFPVPRSIPQNMKDELDYYLLRKERPIKNN